MNDVAQSPRATGLLSAVLLLVLLTSGWSDQSRSMAEQSHVTSCEARAQAAVPIAVSRERRALPRLAAVVANRRPRVLPRRLRVDSFGLPPPRAPTA